MKHTYTYTYIVPFHCDESEYKVVSEWPEDYPNYVAEDAAQDYWDEHDGRDARWPLDIIVKKGGVALGKFSVAQKPRPLFHATEKK